MIDCRKWMLLTMALLFVCLVPLRHVQAYIDPGTGSYLIQIILAAIFGALFTLKVCWKKIKSMVARTRTLLLGDKQGSAK